MYPLVQESAELTAHPQSGQVHTCAMWAISAVVNGVHTKSQRREGIS
jgi:hypothetical protein